MYLLRFSSLSLHDKDNDGEGTRARCASRDMITWLETARGSKSNQNQMHLGAGFRPPFYGAACLLRRGSIPATICGGIVVDGCKDIPEIFLSNLPHPTWNMILIECLMEWMPVSSCLGFLA